MSAILLFARSYWWQLILAGVFILLVGLLKYQSHVIDSQKATIAQRDATIAQIDIVGKAQDKKAVETQGNAKDAVVKNEGTYKDTLERLTNEKPVTRKPVAHSVRPSANSSTSAVPIIPTSPSEFTESRADTDGADSTERITQDCAVTTLQYNTLYQSWEDACQEVECK